MAPSGWGPIIATKSRSTSVGGLIFIAAIILVMAALLLAKNGASSGPLDRAASFLAKNDAFSGPVERKAAVLTRAIANTAIPRPSSVYRKRTVVFREVSARCSRARERENRARLLLIMIEPSFSTGAQAD